jgi:hypothetical protein
VTAAASLALRVSEFAAEQAAELGIEDVAEQVALAFERGDIEKWMLDAALVRCEQFGAFVRMSGDGGELVLLEVTTDPAFARMPARSRKRSARG